MKPKHPQLLSEIELFLSLTNMGSSYFGKKSVGNSEIVSRLRRGGRLWPETIERLRDFMSNEIKQRAEELQ